MTERDWKYCDVREDGYIFMGYGNDRKGRRKPIFYSPAAFQRQRYATCLTAARDRASKAGVCFGIDSDYLNEIWPEESLCPVFGCKMAWSGGDNSPTLDRTVPSKGYVRGNIVWMSSRANRLKYNATADELDAVVRYLRQL